MCFFFLLLLLLFFFFKAEDGIRDLVRSRGLGDVYKRQPPAESHAPQPLLAPLPAELAPDGVARTARVPVLMLSLIHI